MKTKLAALLIVACSAAHAQTGPAWAWNAGKITNNGSVTVKSSSGASTYNAVQNPTGAVAKTNQSAVTQPPTIIIQATSGGYAETIPLFLQNSSVPPSCPAGYTRVYAISQTGCPLSSTFNVGGSRWSLLLTQSTDYSVYWAPDHAPQVTAGGTSWAPASGGGGYCSRFTGYSSPREIYTWSASLCTK